jgi:hypothetical protein
MESMLARASLLDVLVVSKIVDYRCVKHRGQWHTSLRNSTFPVFGSLPVDRVDTALVMHALTPLWAKRIETGSACAVG